MYKVMLAHLVSLFFSLHPIFNREAKPIYFANPFFSQLFSEAQLSTGVSAAHTVCVLVNPNKSPQDTKTLQVHVLANGDSPTSHLYLMCVFMCVYMRASQGG